MKLTLILFLALLLVGCNKQPEQNELWSLQHSEVSVQLKSFVAEKEEQANAVAKAKGKEVPSEVKAFFAAAAKGDYKTLVNSLNDMKMRAPQYGNGHDENLRGAMWQTVLETEGTFEQFAGGDEKYVIAFGDDIIQSIPDGSIYFGGTDPGRFLVTALQKSHVDGNPFFTLTQNALADESYLDYLRSMYGDKIVIPTKEDSQKCFKDYMVDATRRKQNNQLKPGEDVSVDSDGKIQVSGQVSVMEINGLLVKTIFDHNPTNDFYIEESFPLDWMYPYLEPHGLIMKINRQQLPALSDEIIQQDRNYWTKYVQPMIGDWLNSDTSVGEVTAFAEKVYVKKDFNGFKGDPRYVQNDFSCKMFSKLRASLGGLYAWRAQHAADDSEKERMNDEADFAFRQAFALCPYSPETVFRYVQFLLRENRGADALLVADTAAEMPEMTGRDGQQVRDLSEQLKHYQKAN